MRIARVGTYAHHLSAGLPPISGSVFMDNNATGDGGAIYDNSALAGVRVADSAFLSGADGGGCLHRRHLRAPSPDAPADRHLAGRGASSRSYRIVAPEPAGVLSSVREDALCCRRGGAGTHGG